MNENAVTGVSVVMVMVAPGSTVAGHAVMPGRGAGVPSAFSRYGGEKIWPSGWFCLRGVRAMRGCRRDPTLHSPASGEKCIVPTSAVVRVLEGLGSR